MRNDFFEKLNDSERDYSECRGLVSQDPIDEHTLVGKVGAIIADIWERPTDGLARTSVAVAVVAAFERMKIDERVRLVKPVIDSVDTNALDQFWAQGSA